MHRTDRKVREPVNFIKQTLKKLLRQQWRIGFVEGGMDAIMTQSKYKVHWVKYSFPDGWYADPFILDVTASVIIVLAECLQYETNLGSLVKLTVDRTTYKLLSVEPILELDTHLSFPIIQREGEDIFIYPENNQSGNLKLYKYCDNHLEFVSVLCEDPLSDAVITNVNGKDFLLVSDYKNSNGNTICLYTKSRNNGKFVFSKSFSFDRAIARNAGDIFEYHGNLFRPAQDCGERYGGKLLIQKIENIEELTFKDIKVIESPHPTLTRGCHTLNTYCGFVVIDVVGYRHPLLAKLVNNFR